MKEEQRKGRQETRQKEKIQKKQEVKKGREKKQEIKRKQNEIGNKEVMKKAEGKEYNENLGVEVIKVLFYCLLADI